MIDFRYLLITIVAIFLALTVGIATGAGFLGEPLREGLERDVAEVRAENRALNRELDAAEARIDDHVRFAEEAEPWLVHNALAGRQFVVFTFDGTSNAVRDGAIQALSAARGDVVTTINIGARLALQSQPERDLLAAIIGSVSADPSQLRSETARLLGRRAAQLAGTSPGGPRAPSSMRTLLDRLAEEDFLTVDAAVEDEIIPPRASFVVAGGSGDDPPFPVSAFAERLAVELTGADTPVFVVESQDSSWHLVETIRESGEANPVVSTVDQIDNPRGRAALALGMTFPADGSALHLGVGPGAESQLPGAPEDLTP